MSLSYAGVITALCQAVVRDKTLRVQGKSTGYRCKATYSLYPPPLVLSELAMEEVNAICMAVERFTMQDAPSVKAASADASADHRSFYQQHPKFIFEVCAKVTRRGESMLKVVFMNEPAAASSAEGSSPHTLFEMWYGGEEPARLAHFLKSKFPDLRTLVAHVRLRGPHWAAKPDKSCAYLPIPAASGATGTLCVTEYTPNRIPFLLSADSFCEVNHPMEDAIFHTIVEFLKLEGRGNSDARKSPIRRRALFSGRDVNSVVRSFEHYYRSSVAAAESQPVGRETVAVVTTCENVLADTALNGIENVHCVSKDAIHALLQDFMGRETNQDGFFDETHVLITAGRHGLHPSTSQALSDLAGQPRSLTDVIYVSCNVDSFARDLFIMKQGLRVMDARTFDFFPGTDYVMSVIHLVPLVPSVSPSASPVHPDRTASAKGGGLLVLPVGPPGAGKSTCGRALQRFFSVNGESDGGPTKSHGEVRKRRRHPAAGDTREQAANVSVHSSAAAEHKAFIPRTFAQVSSNVRVTVFERDQVFHDLRENGSSLKQTKIAAHEALLAVLLSPQHLWRETPSTCTTASAPAAGGVSNASSALTGDKQARCVATPRTCSLARSLVYLDSTNGSADARQLYERTWTGEGSVGATSDGCVRQEAEAVSATSPTVTLWFASPDDGALLQRVQGRKGHPCFPTDTAEQQRKITVIQSALEPNTAASTRDLVINAGTTEESTVCQVVVAVAAFLHFSPALAQLYFPLALEYIRGQQSSGFA